MRLPKPSASLFVSIFALVVATSSTSYAAVTLHGKDLKNNSVTGSKIADKTLTRADLAPGLLPRNSRWALVNADGKIEAQSGGFKVAAAYPTLPNTATAPAPNNSLRANGNVYINAGERLHDNAIVATIALQNAVDKNGDGVTSGRAAGPDNNPEFSGEISATRCAIPGVVTCAPTGTNTDKHFVVSPRNSDGSVTSATDRKRFYVVIH